METALLLGTLLFQMNAPRILLGALLGVAGAAVVAFLWSRYSHLVDLRRFLQVTAVFLLVFVGQLLLYGVHELSEANVFPNSAAIHDATEPYGPDGIYGQWISFSLIAIPLAWLACSWLADRLKRGRESRTVRAGRPFGVVSGFCITCELVFKNNSLILQFRRLTAAVFAMLGRDGSSHQRLLLGNTVESSQSPD